MTNKIHEVLQRASLFLQENDCEVHIAELLLQHHLRVDRSQFFMMLRDTIPEETERKFFQDVMRHVETKVPVQHLIGHEMFYGRKFLVNKHVLIPRPETEEVVAKAIESIERIVQKSGQAKVVDIGTGSGVIAVTIDLEVQEASVHAVDLSTEALKVAKHNMNQLNAHVEMYEGSFLTPLIEQGLKVDVIVSNPPYIPYKDRETMSATVTNFDPELALFADENGLYAYRCMIESAKQVLHPNGEMIFEIGYDQGETVPALIYEHFPNATVDTYKDINGNDRIVVARL